MATLQKENIPDPRAVFGAERFGGMYKTVILIGHFNKFVCENMKKKRVKFP